MNTNLQKSTQSSLSRLGKSTCMYVCMLVLTLGAVKTAGAQTPLSSYFTADFSAASFIAGGAWTTSYTANLTIRLRDATVTPVREQSFTGLGVNSNNYNNNGVRFGGQSNNTKVSNVPNHPTEDVDLNHGAAWIQSSVTPFPENITKVEVTTGTGTAAFGTPGVMGLFLQVSANADFSDAQNYKHTDAPAASNTYEFTGDWTNSYFRVIVTHTNAGTNSGIVLSSIKFSGPAPTPSDYTITEATNNATLGTVSLTDNVITATPAFCVGYATPAFTITPPEAATVIQAGNTFTVTNLTDDVTVTINFASIPNRTVTLNPGSGTVGTPSLTQTNCEATVTLPAATPIPGWQFAGWSSTYMAETSSVPTNLIPAGAYLPANNITLYAVYAKPTGTQWKTALSRTDIQNSGIASSTTYGSRTITTAANETWTAWASINRNTTNLDSNWLQIRNQTTPIAFIRSPEFSNNVAAVRLTTGFLTAVRNFSIVPVADSVTANLQGNPAGSFGTAVSTGVAGESVWINTPAAPQEFRIYTWLGGTSSGAAPIRDVEVFFAATYKSTPTPEPFVSVDKTDFDPDFDETNFGETPSRIFSITPSALTSDLSLTMKSGLTDFFVAPAIIAQATTTATQITVTFDPSEEKIYEDTIVIGGGGLAEEIWIPVKGIGINPTNPNLTVDQTPISFGTRVLNTNFT